MPVLGDTVYLAVKEGGEYKYLGLYTYLNNSQVEQIGLRIVPDMTQAEPLKLVDGGHEQYSGPAEYGEVLPLLSPLTHPESALFFYSSTNQDNRSHLALLPIPPDYKVGGAYGRLVLRAHKSIGVQGDGLIQYDTPFYAMRTKTNQYMSINDDGEIITALERGGEVPFYLVSADEDGSESDEEGGGDDDDDSKTLWIILGVVLLLLLLGGGAYFFYAKK